MDFLRSSVLEMRSSFATFQQDPRQTVEPLHSVHHSSDSYSELDSEEIPEDIHGDSTCQQSSGDGLGAVDTAVRRRISRPLSSKQAASPACVAPRIPESKKPVLVASAVDSVAAGDSQAQHTVAAVMQLDSGPRAVAHAIAGLGEGEGIMQRLSKQAQSMEGKSAAVLDSILETLSQARHEGVNLTSLFEALISNATTPVMDAVSIPASPQGLTDCTRNTKNAAMRLPRGLLPDVLTKAVPHDHKNEIILRLLGSHDDTSCVVRLKCIEVLDQCSQRYGSDRYFYLGRSASASDISILSSVSEG